jgi:hypothetical protein
MVVIRFGLELDPPRLFYFLKNQELGVLKLKCEKQVPKQGFHNKFLILEPKPGFFSNEKKKTKLKSPPKVHLKSKNQITLVVTYNTSNRLGYQRDLEVA